MFERFTFLQRLQHIILIVTIAILILTGIPLKVPDSLLAKFLIFIFGGLEMRSFIHRAIAVILILIFFFHLAYIIISETGNRDFKSLLPLGKDFKDIYEMLLFYLGKRRERPQFYKFNYLHKFHYIVISVGTIVMIVTGGILWLESYTLAVLPKYFIDIALVIHSWSAGIIFLIVIILHLYNVHLNPDFFPHSKVWLSGLISEEEVKRDYKLWHEKIKSEQKK